LIAKKAGKKVKSGATLQVWNSDGRLSQEFIFTGSKISHTSEDIAKANSDFRRLSAEVVTKQAQEKNVLLEMAVGLHLFLLS
jgi:hypothetical protein